jgi:hypothetical protein
MFVLSDSPSGVVQISNQFHRFGCVSQFPILDIQLFFLGAELRKQVSVTFEGYGVLCSPKVIYGIVLFHPLVNTVLLRTLFREVLFNFTLLLRDFCTLGHCRRDKFDRRLASVIILCPLAWQILSPVVMDIPSGTVAASSH